MAIDKESIHGIAYPSSLTPDITHANANQLQYLRYSTSYEKLGQTFLPGSSYQIAAVDLLLQQFGSPDGYVWVEIWNTYSNLPTSIISSSAVSGRIRAGDITSGSSSEYRFYFPKGISLTSGTRYAIVLRGDYSISTSNYIKWAYNDSSSYTDGQYCTYNGSTWSGAGYDFWFKTYYGAAQPIFLNKSEQVPVGIGTVDPAALLNVRRNGDGEVLRLQSGGGTAGSGPALTFYDTDTSLAGQIASYKYGSNQADLLFYTANSSFIQHMRLSYLGSVVLGKEEALATNAANGFVYIPTCAGAPTQTPTDYNGKAAMVMDTTNNRLYLFNHSTDTWKYVALS